jgi:hypothetical protein
MENMLLVLVMRKNKSSALTTSKTAFNFPEFHQQRKKYLKMRSRQLSKNLLCLVQTWVKPLKTLGKQRGNPESLIWIARRLH